MSTFQGKIWFHPIVFVEFSSVMKNWVLLAEIWCAQRYTEKKKVFFNLEKRNSLTALKHYKYQNGPPDGAAVLPQNNLALEYDFENLFALWFRGQRSISANYF